MAGTHKGEKMPTRKYVSLLILKKADEHGSAISDLELCLRMQATCFDTVDLPQVQDHIKELVAHGFLTAVSSAHENTKRYRLTHAGHAEVHKHTAHAKGASFHS